MFGDRLRRRPQNKNTYPLLVEEEEGDSPPMATANTTSPSAGKPATAKRTAARTKTASTARPRRTAAQTTSTSYAERAVLIPVGAALIARDRVVSSVNDAISSYASLSSYASPSKAQTQLTKFERRGITARNRLEREVRKTRTRVERELRQRRRDGTELVDRLQERVLNLV